MDDKLFDFLEENGGCLFLTICLVMWAVLIVASLWVELHG